MLGVSTSALSDLRRTRRKRRLGDTEWFDVAYHVYLAAFLGGTAIVILSGYIGDGPLGEADVQRVLDRGPAYLGVVVALAIAIGIRSGAEGGPLSIEPADSRHLLLAPIPRRSVLRQPYLQRVRTIAGGAALVGAIGGLLAQQRMPGSPLSWVVSGAAFGACVGIAVVAFAVHAHAIRLRGWMALVIGAAICGWQLWAALGEHTGPFDSLGDLALWGYEQVPVDLISVGVVLVIALVALVTVGRLRVEHLDRRSELVSQLRFAVTTQDLRTVVLLRRQLRQEQPRDHPLVRPPALHGGRSSAVIRRSLVSMLRAPLARHARVIGLGAAAGVAAGVAARGNTPAVLVCGALLFVMGLDLIEPLSQEVDHPSRTDELAVESGWLQLRLLAAPAVFAVVPALAGAAMCILVDPDSVVPALALAVPITLAGMTGSVVNAVRDDIYGAQAESALVPPEMAGMKNVIVMLIPLVVSTIGTVAILAVRARPTAQTVLQLVVALGLYVAAVGWWLVKRHDLRSSWSQFKQEAMP